jgi:hypothetical protein
MAAGSHPRAGANPTLHFVPPVNASSPTDLEVVSAKQCAHAYTVITHSSVDAALDAAVAGDGLAVLAGLTQSVQGDPMANAMSTTTLTQAQMSRIAELNLRVYWEFPRSLNNVGLAAGPLQMGQTLWERAVAVSAIGPATPNMSLLHPHKQVDYVVLPTATVKPLIVLSKVAGYESATDGLPTKPGRVLPLLATMPSQWVARDRHPAVQRSHEAVFSLGELARVCGACAQPRCTSGSRAHHGAVGPVGHRELST